MCFLLVLCAMAQAQTVYYVDPDYDGSQGAQDGSASRPWTALDDSHAATRWTTIGTALASGPVTVYYSARSASGSVKETMTTPVTIYRVETSTNRLTIDGMSKYNTSDTNPSWIDNPDTSVKMHIQVSNAIAIGWAEFRGKQNYITMRGFEVSGAGARVFFGGSETILEHIWTHDITGIGPAINVHKFVDQLCVDKGSSTNFTIRNNLIENTFGEGIYIGGNYATVNAGGCPSFGNGHSGLLIENNVINNPGANGGEGDGIDIKFGILNVTIRGNTIINTGASSDGIVGAGIHGDGATPANYLIENNYIRDTPGFGIAFTNMYGIIFRNNVVIDAGTLGMGAGGGEFAASTNGQFYNNTVVNCGSNGLGYDESGSNVVFRNNIIINTLNKQLRGPLGSTTSDHNIYMALPVGQPTIIEGAGSLELSAAQASALFVNIAAGNAQLAPGSLALNAGIPVAGFSTDLLGVPRPQGSAWDMGAYEDLPGGEARWPFDDGAGSSLAQEFTGNGEDGILTGCNPSTVWVGGQVLGALSLASNCYVDFGDAVIADFAAGQDFTVLVWVKTSTALATDQYPHIVHKSGAGVGWRIIRAASNDGGGEQWYGEIKTSGGLFTITAFETLHDGAWHLLTLQRQGLIMRTFHDGVLVGEETHATLSEAIGNADDLRVGRSNFASPDEFWYTGLVDELQVYDRALTANEIRAIAGTHGKKKRGRVKTTGRVTGGP